MRRTLAANPSMRRRRRNRVTDSGARSGVVGGVVSPCRSDTGAEAATRITVGAATAAPGASTAAAASSITQVATCRIRRRGVVRAAGMSAWGGPTDRTSTPNTSSAAAVSPPCDGSVNQHRSAPTQCGGDGADRIRYMVSAKLTCPSPRSTFLSSLPEALRGSLPSQRSMYVGTL